MRLQRNIAGHNRFVVIDMQKLGRFADTKAEVLTALEEASDEEFSAAVQLGAPGDPDEHFVLKLKDRNAQAALLAYAESAAQDDPALARDVRQLASQAGPAHPHCKQPD